MLNRKCLFGGLCLVSNAVIAISASSVAVAKGIDDALNTLGQILWRFEACNIIEEAKFEFETEKIKDKPWFIDGYYDKSIKKVIGKALADCVTNRNEFKNKGAQELITFEGSTIDDYKLENWNAVMLYNYVNVAIKGEKNTTTQKVLADCVEALFQYYRTNQKQLKIKDISAVFSGLRKGLYNIQQYLNVLRLSKESKLPGTDDIFINQIKDLYDKYNKHQSEDNKKALFNVLNKELNNVPPTVRKYDSQKKLCYRFAPLFDFWDNEFRISCILGDTIMGNSSGSYVKYNEFKLCEKDNILETIKKFDPHLLEGLDVNFYDNLNDNPTYPSNFGLELEEDIVLG